MLVRNAGSAALREDRLQQWSGIWVGKGRKGAKEAGVQVEAKALLQSSRRGAKESD